MTFIIITHHTIQNKQHQYIQSLHVPIHLVVLKPEAVSIADPPELVQYDGPEQLARTLGGRLQHAGRPDVQFVDGVLSVQRLQLSEYLRVLPNNQGGLG